MFKLGQFIEYLVTVAAASTTPKVAYHDFQATIKHCLDLTERKYLLAHAPHSTPPLVKGHTRTNNSDKFCCTYTTPEYLFLLLLM